MTTSEQKRKAGWLLEALAKDPDPPKKGRKNRNLVFFLANKEEIERALDAGWNAKAIWKTLHEAEAYPGTYDTFILYKNRYFNDEKPSVPPKGDTSVEEVPDSPPPALPQKADSGICPDKFKYDVTYDPKGLWNKMNKNNKQEKGKP